MLARMLIVVLVGLMALPLGAGTPVAEAKSRKKTVVRTFTSTAPISLPGSGPANPYPAPITVKGLKKGKILDVNVILNGFSYDVPDDIDVLLAASHLPGRNAIIMSDVGGAQAVNNITLTLDDAAANALPDNGPLTSGTFRPTNIDSGIPDSFPAPAPTPSGNSLLSVFNGENPNGEWQLFINDAPGKGPGSLSGGWTLEITAKVKKKRK